MLKVMSGGKVYRTRDAATLARRLYGQKAVAMIVEENDKSVIGKFAVPDRRDPSIYHVRKEFVSA